MFGLRCLLAAFVLAIAACGSGSPRFSGTDVTGAEFGKDFRLLDQNGVERTLADFRGKAVALFFGYTHCPDVCPTTLATMREAMQQLGDDRSRLQVIFITVDPQRDTAELLGRYVTAFDPSFLGLRGDAQATERTAREFKVLVSRHAGTKPDNYSVDHSTGIYLFDPEGRLRVYLSHSQGADVLAHDVRELLRTSGAPS